jgi:putative ABC transport system permease protein
MKRVALKGILGRKMRTILTAFAIVLGVSMVSGSYVLTDTISKAFNTIFQSSYSQTDAVISGKKVVQYAQSGNALVSQQLLARVEKVDGVAAASGEIIDYNGNSDQAKILDKQGKVITGSGNPTFGFGLDPAQPQFNPMKLTAGRWADGRNEVVFDAGTARAHGFHVGDRVRIAVGGIHRFRLVGIAKFGDVDSIGGATIAVFDPATARTLLVKDGYDIVSVSAKSGVSQQDLIANLKLVLPPSVQVQTGAERARSDEGGIATFLKVIRYALLGFGGIALFVGGFVIFNTLSITVAQRTRELATLRTLGASRRQVLRSVVLEAFVLGFGASLVGLVCGIGLAKGLSALFKALDLALPEASTVIALRTPLVAVGMGTLVTVAAGLLPAIRATRVAPVAAVREGATVATGHTGGRSMAVALAVVAASVASLGYGLYATGVPAPTRILALVGGSLALFVGTAMVAPRLVRPLASVVGRPAAAFGGVAGRLARDNAVRDTGRTASTAAALMIGLALVTFVSVLATALRGSDARAIERQLDADYVAVTQNGWAALPPTVGEKLTATRGVQVASAVRGEQAKVDGSEVGVSGIDPATIGEVYRFDWKTRVPLAALGGTGAIVSKELAADKHLSVGGSFLLTTPAGRRVDLTVRGVYAPPTFDPLLGAVVLTQQAFDRNFQRPSDSLVLVRSDRPVAELASALGTFPDARVLTQSAFITDRTKDMTDMLNMLYVLLALSVVVSLFGMINTLVLSVFERTREIGMLRAVGLTRRQTRRMVRHESVVIALIGAALGIPLGIGLAAGVTGALAKYGLSFSIPVGSLVAFGIVAAVAGIVAAVMPARRAARLNVLQALQYE